MPAAGLPQEVPSHEDSDNQSQRDDYHAKQPALIWIREYPNLRKSWGRCSYERGSHYVHLCHFVSSFPLTKGKTGTGSLSHYGVTERENLPYRKPSFREHLFQEAR